MLTGFDHYNFYLSGSAKNGDTILTVTDFAVDMTGAVVLVGIEGNASALKKGDTVTLVNAAQGLTTAGISQATGMQGLSLLYDFALSFDPNNLYATVTQDGANPQVKAQLEGRIGSAAFVGQGAELVAGPGMLSALAAAQSAHSGPFTFGTMGGGTSRYNTGSHVDVDGFSLMAGFGWNVALDEGKNGKLLLGPFFEAGWGSYSTYNSFRDASSVKGNGDINYYGSGLMARYDTPYGFYIDSSLRGGRVEMDFDSGDIRNTITGEKANYESGAAYYGLHTALGYLWDITDPMTLDTYTRYLWTRQEGDSVSMAGERYRFDAVDSHRWITGARLLYDAPLESGAVLTPYIGAAFDYEFDSESTGTVNGRKIDSPDLKGATGSGELGFSFKPAATSALSFDLGAQGYTGKREGVSGSVQFKFEF